MTNRLAWMSSHLNHSLKRKLSWAVEIATGQVTEKGEEEEDDDKTAEKTAVKKPKSRTWNKKL